LYEINNEFESRFFRPDDVVTDSVISYKVENSFMAAHPDGWYVFIDGRTNQATRLRIFEDTPAAEKAAQAMQEIGVKLLPADEANKRWEERL